MSVVEFKQRKLTVKGEKDEGKEDLQQLCED